MAPTSHAPFKSLSRSKDAARARCLAQQSACLRVCQTSTGTSVMQPAAKLQRLIKCCDCPNLRTFSNQKHQRRRRTHPALVSQTQNIQQNKAGSVLERPVPNLRGRGRGQGGILPQSAQTGTVHLLTASRRQKPLPAKTSRAAFPLWHSRNPDREAWERVGGTSETFGTCICTLLDKPRSRLWRRALQPDSIATAFHSDRLSSPLLKSFCFGISSGLGGRAGR